MERMALLNRSSIGGELKSRGCRLRDVSAGDARFQTGNDPCHFFIDSDHNPNRRELWMRKAQDVWRLAQCFVFLMCSSGFKFPLPGGNNVNHCELTQKSGCFWVLPRASM